MNKIIASLEKAIKKLESVALWSSRLDYEPGESPSEIVGVVLIYLQELLVAMKNFKKSAKINSGKEYDFVNEWIGKIIFLRQVLVKVDFSEYDHKNTEAKEEALREIVSCENLLRELRGDSS